ncbi:MAG: type III restriction enzyme, res subunit [Marinobacter sp. T13-3]|nr:MAG: type III restriction enzyme, res subunit [Marinobacter sp. T13-3]
MGSMSLDLAVAQGSTLIPERFQVDLITNLGARLQSEQRPPCLLRAPTGSGKTFVVSRTLANISAKEDVIWFWFVPFTNLVSQTLDDLVTNGTDLTPTLFTQGVNQQPGAGQVLISTVQGVSRKAWRREHYDAGGGEQARTPAEFLALARANELKVGVVVDEAHIALDEATEFGHFVNWLSPDYLTMATATPKNDRINAFLASAGMSAFESFGVSRDDVVQARLNKQYIEAVVYRLQETTNTVADLKRTVLRQAWFRNLALQDQLQAAGIDLTPLLLVQVDNGKGTIEEAERDLVELCGVPINAIGKHSSDEPNPQMMEAIAVDPTKRVLIFKQSAGTGFNAPRAFVLASLKSVSDRDFAMQFIGRVMRVARPIRNAYQTAADIPADLNTAYVYLANAEAQQGYQQAVQVTNQVKTNLEGEVERLRETKTRNGGTKLTNRPDPQGELNPRSPLPTPVPPTPHPGQPSGSASGQPSPSNTSDQLDGGTGHSGTSSGGPQNGFWEELDTDAPEATPAPVRPNPRTAGSWEEWRQTLADRGVAVYPLRTNVANLPEALQRESRPEVLDMQAISERVATQITITARQEREAVLAARNKLRGTELHTELTTNTQHANDDALIVVDRNRVAREAVHAMERLPQVEPDDHAIIVNTLAQRLMPAAKDQLLDAGEPHDPATVKRLCRTAAYWLVRRLIDDLAERLHAEIAKEAVIAPGDPIPRAMLFPSELPLPLSANNVYGILPPSASDLNAVDQTLMMDDRALMQVTEWEINGERFATAPFDHTFRLNDNEQAFADALDRADYVEWWFRNPEKKSYAVRIVRGEHRNYFFPDFVVCLSHVEGQQPKQRLAETKHDLKDARRKALHIPEHYGKVLFLTRDNGKLYVVTDNGGIGAQVDLGDLETLRAEFRKTAP